MLLSEYKSRAVLAALLLLPLSAFAQPAATQPAPDPSAANRPQKIPGIYGIILGMDSAGVLTIVDREGKTQRIATNSQTAYLLGKTESTHDEVIKPGMTIKAYMSADGTVADGVSARGPAMELQANQLRALMQATDEEWSVLSPRIERVRELQRIVDGRWNGPPPKGDPSQQQPTARMVMRTLLSDFWNSGETPRALIEDLDTLRQIRAKARADLAYARKELQDIVTPRQEVLLVLQGILE